MTNNGVRGKSAQKSSYCSFLEQLRRQRPLAIRFACPSHRQPRSREISGLAWLAAAEVYLDLKRQAESLNALFDEAKEKLVGLVSHPSESGAGVTVTQFWKQGSVDYKKEPELRGW